MLLEFFLRKKKKKTKTTNIEEIGAFPSPEL